MRKVLVIGGAGYVGSSLVAELNRKNYQIIVYDLFLFGNEVIPNHPKINKIKADVRETEKLKDAVENSDIIIHLACISNDPSFELNPELGKSINYDSFKEFIKILENQTNDKLVIYASSSSVYGIKDVKNVTEDMSLEPLTDYSYYKCKCEDMLLNLSNNKIKKIIFRPATVCGYSRRQRLDVVVNIMTMHGYYLNKIKVFGGKQLRPNINILDMVNAYIHIIENYNEKINNEIFNVGGRNANLDEIANIVNKKLIKKADIENIKTDDNRSYHISSIKFIEKTGFKFSYTIDQAIESLIHAFETKLLIDPLNNEKYINLKLIKNIKLT